MNGNGTSSHDAVLQLDTHALPPQQYLMSLMQLRTLSKCIELLVEYKLANNISSIEPIEVATLAKRLEYDEGNLRRILSFVASHGILKELSEEDKFVGTDLSDMLRDDTPGNIAEMVRHFSRREMQLALIDMGACLKTGGASFPESNGDTYYEYLSKQPELEKTFDKAIANFSLPLQNKLVYTLYDFSRFPTVVEIGGGRGGLLEKILRQNPNVHATLFERDAVLSNIMPELNSFRSRFRTVGGDALQAVDVEADLFIITNMLNNFNDEDAAKILSNVAKAMAKSQKDREASRLLLVEADLGDEPPNQPSLFKRGFDMWMMYLMGGKSRSKQALKELLTKSGLKVTHTTKVPPMHVAYECQLV